MKWWTAWRKRCKHCWHDDGWGWYPKQGCKQESDPTEFLHKKHCCVCGEVIYRSVCF